MAVPSSYQACAQLPLFALEKRCSTCGVLKPLEAFGTSPKGRYGRRSQCRECCNKQHAAWHAAHQEEQGTKARAWRHAHPDYFRVWEKNNPEKAKAYNKASKAKRAEAIKEYRKAYYRAHAEEQKAKTHTYIGAHAGELREKRLAKYHATPQKYREMARERRKANPDAHREAGMRYYYKDIERARAIARKHYWASPEKLRERTRQWRRTNPEKARLLDMRNHAQRRAAEGTFTKQDITALEAQQAGLCYYCQQPYGRYHVDHKQPVSRGGTNWPANLCLACAPCNWAKRDKTEAEFRTWRAMYSRL